MTSEKTSTKSKYGKKRRAAVNGRFTRTSPSHLEHKTDYSHRLAHAAALGGEAFVDKASYGAWEQGRKDHEWRDTSRRRVRDEEPREQQLSVGPELEPSYLFDFNGVTYRIGGQAA
jgi:hypothetical protein